jgi:hypothetical protein
MELKKYIEYYKSGKIQYVCLIDEEGYRQGEYIRYNKDGRIYEKGFFKDNFWIGRIYEKGFFKDNFWIGRFYDNEKYYFRSFINLGREISEPEYKKELAMVRLGLIEEPVEFSYLLKDY